MPKRTYTPEQRAEALQLYETQGPKRAAKETGIPRNTITTWAQTAGVSSSRASKTRAASDALSADAANRRAAAALKAITLADKLLDILSERVADESDDIPVKDLAIMFGIMADKHRLLTEMDTASDSYAAVDAWLLHLTAGPAEKSSRA